MAAHPPTRARRACGQRSAPTTAQHQPVDRSEHLKRRFSLSPTLPEAPPSRRRSHNSRRRARSALARGRAGQKQGAGFREQTPFTRHRFLFGKASPANGAAPYGRADRADRGNARHSRTMHWRGSRSTWWSENNKLAGKADSIFEDRKRALSSPLRHAAACRNGLPASRSRESLAA
jgi:hypothetical protein